MAKENEVSGVQPEGGAGAGRWITSDENKAKARKFFEHAKKATEQRNYDYAIKLYADGLAFWPDAQEEGLKPLRVVATARKLDGGKHAGFMDTRRRSITGKDSIQSLNNALYLYGFDPSNPAYPEQILQLGSKLRCDGLVHWVAPVLVDVLSHAKKLPESHYQAACEAMEATAELCDAVSEDAAAMDILNAAISTTQIWNQQHPDSHIAPKARSDATGRLTILKGRFSKAEGFTDSLKDAAGQQDIRDRERTIHAPDRAKELIARARREWDANRDVPNKLLGLVDLMIRNEDPIMEAEAIHQLEGEFASSKNYIFKSKADDIRIRQMNRERRELAARVKADANNAESRQLFNEQALRQNAAEIAILEDRVRQYPTELRFRFQLGTRYFVAQRFDEAIPLFQQAQMDGRCRVESRLFIGRCFFEKGFYDQSVDMLRSTSEEVNSMAGVVALELNYWLGRGLEASEKPAEARKVYGQLIQLDYNFKDARQRLERLVAGDKK